MKTRNLTSIIIITALGIIFTSNLSAESRVRLGNGQIQVDDDDSNVVLGNGKIIVDQGDDESDVVLGNGKISIGGEDIIDRNGVRVKGDDGSDVEVSRGGIRSGNAGIRVGKRVDDDEEDSPDIEVDEDEGASNVHIKKGELRVGDGDDAVLIRKGKLQVGGGDDGVAIDSSGIHIRDSEVGDQEISGRAGNLHIKQGNESITLGAGNSIKITDGSSTINLGDGSWRKSKNGSGYNTDTVMKELKVQQHDKEIKIDLSESVLFDFNSDSVKPKAAQVLAKVAYLIREKSNGAVVIEGHTDSVGSDDYNQKLSERRVKSVMEWLRDGENIPAKIMQGMAYGEGRPVAHNTNPDGSDNPEGRKLNRRVSVIFKNT